MKELSLYLSIEHNITTENAVGTIMEFVRSGVLLYNEAGRIVFRITNATADSDPFWHSYETPLIAQCWSCGKEYAKTVIPNAVSVVYSCDDCDVSWTVNIKSE